MEKEINEVKITYLAETGTGLVHLWLKIALNPLKSSVLHSQNNPYFAKSGYRLVPR